MQISKTLKTMALIVVPALAATAVVSGQNGNPSQGTVFRTTTNFVSTAVIVRDKQGQFVPDLREDEFHVFEDGVRQKISLFQPWVGGRSLGNLVTTGGVPSTLPKIPGLVLPKAKPRTDSSGRLFIVFIDDLHVTPAETPQVKVLLKKIRDELVHDNDLVGFVSTGTSAISMDPSYDYGHRRFDEAISKVMGSAPTADEYIDMAGMEGAEGPQNVRFNAHVTFSTAADILEALGNVQDRRKAFVYVSNGYDFNPFSEARLQKIKDNYAQSNPNYDPTAGPEAYQSDNSTVGSGSDDPTNVMNQDYKKRNEFSISDLVGEIAQLTRIAQRSNVTFYTIDPRGLIGTGSDASVRAEVKYGDWRDFFEMQHSTLQTLAEETGGFAAVDTNDFDRVIRRIDAETSDYYLIGYTSSNPDPFKIRRFIKIEVTRPNLQPPIYRSEYTLPRPKGKPPAPAAPQSPSQK